MSAAAAPDPDPYPGRAAHGRAQQPLVQAAAHAGLDDLLHLVTGAAGQVRQPLTLLLAPATQRGAAHSSSSTRRRHTPAWMTSWILSLVPSDRYDSAQHASVSTSSSLEWISLASVGSASLVCARAARSALRPLTLRTAVAVPRLAVTGVRAGVQRGEPAWAV